MGEPIVNGQKMAAIPIGHKPFSVIRIDKQKSLLLAYSVFVLFVLFEPAYIRNESNFHALFRISKFAVAATVLFFFIIRKVKLNALSIGTIAFEGLLLLSTVLNGSAIEVWISECAYIIILILFVQMVMEQDARLLLLALSIVLGLYTHINTLCRVLFPYGMYTDSLGYQNCWLLGYDNGSCMVIQLAITVGLFRILYYRNCFLLWDWSIIVSGCWFILLQEVATGIVSGTLFFVFMIVSRNERIRKHFSIGLLGIIGMFFLFFLIQFFNIQENSFFTFVFKVLGRNTTFTGRTKIWSAAWRDIINGGWLFGRGLQTTAMYQNHFGARVWVHLHSYFLQVIYEGGFLAFTALFGVLMYVAARFDKGKYNHAYMSFLGGLLAIMLMWQTEAYGDLIKYGFVILSLMYNAPLLVQTEESYNKPRIHFRLSH